MVQAIKGRLTPEQKDFLEELYLKGEVDFVKYKMPRRPKLRNEELKWITKMAELIKKLKHTPRQAQIAVSKMEEFQEWSRRGVDGSIRSTPSAPIINRQVCTSIVISRNPYMTKEVCR